MQIVVTAVGPDNAGLADPIIHYVTGQGANIAEIQMYDHDEAAVFAMMMRVNMPGNDLTALRSALTEIGRLKKLSVRVWSPEERATRPRLAICTTYRQEPPLALLPPLAEVPPEPPDELPSLPQLRHSAPNPQTMWESFMASILPCMARSRSVVQRQT